MKILAWDLETTNLNANFGIVLCAGYNEVGTGNVKVRSVSDFKGNLLESERKLLKEFSAELLEADCWLTWFGTYFDIPFLNSRLLYHGLPVVPPNFSHIDGWRTAKNRLKLNSNRLASVQSFLNLPDEKTHIKPEMWLLAMSGDKGALKYIVEHCYQDVVVLEQAYNILRPLIIDHPNQNLVKPSALGCPVCGGTKLQKRGTHIAKTRAYQRYHCQGCGAWSKSVKANLKVDVKL